MKHSVTQHGVQEINQIISGTWDKNVFARAMDLENLSDSSYTETIEPWVLQHVVNTTSPDSMILDVGCGCGFMTNAVFQSGRKNIQGIDLSPASVAYSQKKYPHITFRHQDLYLLTQEAGYDLCMAIMVANNVPCIQQFFSVMHKVLRIGGKLVLVIPHPCFWPEKRICSPSYCYKREDSYMLPFSTKGRKDYASHIYYFHRPLESYIQCILESGFEISLCQGLYETAQQEKPDILGMVLTNRLI